MRLRKKVSKSKHKKFYIMKNKISYLYLIILAGSFFSSVSLADEFFNPALLSGNTDLVADLSRYEKGEGQPAGKYLVEIYLNKYYVGTQELNFSVAAKNIANRDDSGLVPCLTTKWLSKQNVNILAIPSLANYTDDQCLDIAVVIPDANTEFEFERQVLNISVPQAFLQNDFRGYISPKLWDNGITAALLNYRFTGSHVKRTDDGNNTNYYLNLSSGFNIGAWRLRNEGAWSYNHTKKSTSNTWTNINTYAERSIVALKSNLVLGDSFTDSDIFDSVGFRGFKLKSDERMLPDSLRGFAPTIRGIANSNAQVIIEQNGYTIYQTYVPPGPFEIQDLYPTSNSGDLKVTVQEANGTSSQFTVPYSAVPLLQRENRIKYAITGGEYRTGNNNQENPRFGQGTLFLGLKDGWTIYKGMLIAQNYQAFAIGVGKNLGSIGAFSADITHANSSLPDGSKDKGQSIRFLYAKSLNEWGTNFQLLGYRYSTEGFYSFAETTYKQMKGYQVNTQNGAINVEPVITDYHNLYYTKKGRIQANISQSIGEYGSVYVLGNYQSYWNSSEIDKLFQVGYNGSWSDVTVGVNASLNKSFDMKGSDKRISLSLSVPLGKLFASGRGKVRDLTTTYNSSYATYTTTYDQNNRASQLVGVSGTLLEKNNLNYNVQQGYINKNVGASGSVGIDYKGGYGNSNVGYSYGKDWQQVNYGVSGGILVHENGVTFSQPMNDTSILVKAPGAANVGIENATGVTTDWRGYAVIPYATAFRENRVSLNTKNLGEDVEIEYAVDKVVPTAGAVVRAEFTPRIGYRALLTLRQLNGQPIPFGAIVRVGNDGNSGIVGDDGQVFLSGLKPTGELQVVWGYESHKRCSITYDIPAKKSAAGLYSATAKCN